MELYKKHDPQSKGGGQTAGHAEILLLAAVLCQTAGQPFLSAIWMSVTRRTLSPAVYFFLGFGCTFLTLLLLAVFFRFNEGRGGLAVLYAELRLWTFTALWQLPWQFISGYSLEDMLDSFTVLWIFALVWVVLGLWMLSVLVHGVIYAAYSEDGKNRLLLSVLYVLRHPLYELVACVLILLYFVLQWIVFFALALAEPYIGESFLSMMAKYILMALAQYTACRFLFSWIRAKGLKPRRAREAAAHEDSSGEEAEEAPGQREMPSERSPKPVVLLVCTLIALAVLTGSTVICQSDEAFATGAERLLASVRATLEEGNDAILSGKFETAMQKINTAASEIKAVDAFANEDSASDVLTGLYQENPSDVLIGAVCLACDVNRDAIEQRLTTGQLDESWYPVMLDDYASRESLDDTQKEMQSRLVAACVAGEQFVSDIPNLSRLTNRRKISRDLDNYETYAASFTDLQLLLDYEKTGYVTAEIAEEALSLAEANPDQMLYQYEACQIASEYQVDNATHYERTLECAARFDELYSAQETDTENLASVKRQLGDVASNCYDYETALNYYTQSYELSESADVALDIAQAYEQREDYASCLEWSKKILDSDAENDRALYLECISALKQGNTDEALSAAENLASLTAKALEEGTGAQSMEQELYSCVQFLSMNDSSQYTEYSYCIYPDLTEEQKTEIQSVPLLWDYMTAVYYCFMQSGEDETALAATQNLLKVSDQLVYAYYLEGCIYYANDQFEEACTAYTAAEQLNAEVPALLYALANTYDALEDYETAYQYSLRVAQMAPEQDHGYDWYGISIHNGNLLNALKQELGISD